MSEITALNYTKGVCLSIGISGETFDASHFAIIYRGESLEMVRVKDKVEITLYGVKEE